MDFGVRCKAMRKDEVKYLLSLVQASPILTCKATDGTTNRLKEEAWQCLTDTFNFERDIPRSKEQLKLKWENLKKSARKKAHLIEMRNAAGGNLDAIENGEILDRVIRLLQSTSASEAKNMNVDVDEDPLENGSAPAVTPPTPSRRAAPRDTPRMYKNKFKRKTPEDGRLQRDLSIAKYYQLKAEKLRLEIKLLNMEIANKEKHNE